IEAGLRQRATRLVLFGEREVFVQGSGLLRRQLGLAVPGILDGARARDAAANLGAPAVVDAATEERALDFLRVEIGGLEHPADVLGHIAARWGLRLARGEKSHQQRESRGHRVSLTGG